MPLSISILNIHGYEITKIHGRKPLIYEARFIGKINCPFCRSDNLRKKDKYTRVLNHETIGLRRTELHLEARKFYCKSCGRYFNQRFPGILKCKRSTEAFRAEVFARHVNGHAATYFLGELRDWYSYSLRDGFMTS
ncbi:MAG: transposase family protein [Candidatus Humimicrobiaceae bacterium]